MFNLKNNLHIMLHLFAGSTVELLCLTPTKPWNVFMLSVLTLLCYSQHSQSELSDLVRCFRLTSDWLAASLPRAQGSAESVSRVNLLRTPSGM